MGAFEEQIRTTVVMFWGRDWVGVYLDHTITTGSDIDLIVANINEESIANATDV